MHDTDFGLLKFNEIDAWDSRVEFRFPHATSQYFAVHLWADEAGPSKVQRLRFRDLLLRYIELWPQIANRIGDACPQLKATGVGVPTTKYVGVHIGEHCEDSLELVYHLDVPGNQSYFVSFDDWAIQDVYTVD